MFFRAIYKVIHSRANRNIAGRKSRNQSFMHFFVRIVRLCCNGDETNYHERIGKMKNIVLSLLLVAWAVSFGYATEKGVKSPSPLGKATSRNGLVGTWVSSDGSTELKVVSNTKLLYNNEPFACKIEKNILYVMDEGQMVPYPYRISGNQLELLFPEGYSVVFVKAGSSAASVPPATNRQQGYPQQRGGGYTRGSAENGLLQGRYCSYSSSGGYGSSSYSSSNWAVFDGQGNFQYGSGGYYSGGGDVYGSEGADGRGTYEVHGDTIILRYPDGSSEQAYVHYRGSGGRITEVKYGSTLYAKQLCD